MKIISTIVLFSMIFAPSDAIDVALAHKLVQKAEAVRYGGDIYVAILTEPVYLRSENELLRKEIESDIEKKSGANAHVVIDLGAYLKIKRINALSGTERENEINKLIKVYFSRYIDENRRYNQS